jgi:tRNA(adenine34) deaminase
MVCLGAVGTGLEVSTVQRAYSSGVSCFLRAVRNALSKVDSPNSFPVSPNCHARGYTTPLGIIGTVTDKIKPDSELGEGHSNAPGPDEPCSAEPSPRAARDLAMMRRALGEAARAAKRGEVPVGAVVVRGEEILAVAHNEREATKDPTAHAELLALRRAATRTGSWRLTDCTLYTTLEPCPMCTGALHAARIGRLVYAAPDPKAGAAGTLYDLPADSRLNHTYPYTPGILQSEAAALLHAFFKERRRQ